MSFSLTINGKPYTVDAHPNTPLLWVLRDHLNLTGTKYSCGQGLCGSCTVHLDGESARSCQTPVAAVGRRKVTTIEGLADALGHRVPQAWIAEQVPQCGYCQSGQIMEAAALLAKHPKPTPKQVEEVMSGMLCRCGTYQALRLGIERAAAGGAR
jgi:aerobic-type carbon monoxide dehydrogenase small subunit (CoxS/CutS family)